MAVRWRLVITAERVTALSSAHLMYRGSGAVRLGACLSLVATKVAVGKVLLYNHPLVCMSQNYVAITASKVYMHLCVCISAVMNECKQWSVVMFKVE